VFQQNPQFTPPPVADDDADDERPAPNVPVPAQPGAARGPVFNTFPQPQVVNPQNQPMPQPGAPVPQQGQPGQPSASPTPVVPYGGVAVPGMVAPPPAPVPGQPTRRPGGPGGL
jgi:hypothetical protein